MGVEGEGSRGVVCPYKEETPEGRLTDHVVPCLCAVGSGRGGRRV